MNETKKGTIEAVYPKDNYTTYKISGELYSAWHDKVDNKGKPGDTVDFEYFLNKGYRNITKLTVTGHDETIPKKPAGAFKYGKSPEEIDYYKRSTSINQANFLVKSWAKHHADKKVPYNDLETMLFQLADKIYSWLKTDTIK